MNDKKKIAVIADDFTGAAEIGGIGLRHGLRVAIETEPVNTDVDLLVIATDTRSMSPEEAAETIKSITRKLKTFDPFFIYKKIDSVLRGNISEELCAQLEAEEKTKAVIVAGNPIFKRLINNGQYHIAGIPLHETNVWRDAYSPIKSNHVLDILAPSKKLPIINTKPGSKLPENGLIMGDVNTLEDLTRWTEYFDKDILFAGASGFFDALLTALHYKGINKNTEIPRFGSKAFFVLGSYYPKDKDLLNDMKNNGHMLCNMPEAVYDNKSDF